MAVVYTIILIVSRDFSSNMKVYIMHLSVNKNEMIGYMHDGTDSGATGAMVSQRA